MSNPNLPTFRQAFGLHLRSSKEFRKTGRRSFKNPELKSIGEGGEWKNYC